ncbi:hypothetical protein ACO0LD_31615 [Undibacterium sp. Ji83W]|uniref:hypothetical protein n=1 Tax=Undibacterium sp. Ji83W TaxID=3413043 RepID=UPI003BEFC2D4
MRIISNEELLAVAGGDAAATRGERENSWGETTDSGNLGEINSNGDSGISGMINGTYSSFSCNNDTASCTLTVGDFSVKVTVLCEGLGAVTIDGVTSVVPMTITVPPIDNSPIPDIVPFK